MAGEDLKEEVQELREQIESLREALAQATEPYRELMRYVGRLQDLARNYFRLLELYARHGSVSPDLVLPGLKDDISRHIVLSLFEKPDRNITQITDAVRARRGTASRRIVRERLKALTKRGVVTASPGSRSRSFRISDEVVDKWSQVLGFPKYGDRRKAGAEESGDEHV